MMDDSLIKNTGDSESPQHYYSAWSTAQPNDNIGRIITVACFVIPLSVFLTLVAAGLAVRLVW